MDLTSYLEIPCFHSNMFLLSISNSLGIQKSPIRKQIHQFSLNGKLRNLEYSSRPHYDDMLCSLMEEETSSHEIEATQNVLIINKTYAWALRRFRITSWSCLHYTFSRRHNVRPVSMADIWSESLFSLNVSQYCVARVRLLNTPHFQLHFNDCSVEDNENLSSLSVHCSAHIHYSWWSCFWVTFM